MLGVLSEPGYDSLALPLVDREKDPVVKYRALFYLACHYEDLGKPMTARTYYQEVRDTNYFHLIEQRLAEEALKRSR